MSQFTINQKELCGPVDYNLQCNAGAYNALTAVLHALHRQHMEHNSPELDEFIKGMEDEIFNCRIYLNDQVMSILDNMEQEVNGAGGEQ